MRIVDVAHTLAAAEYPGLEELRAAYGWSDRNHRIFQRMFGLRSAALHPGVPLIEALRSSAATLAERNPEIVGRVDRVYYCHAVNSTLPADRDLLGRMVRETLGGDPEVMSVAHGSCTSAILVMRTLLALPPEARLNAVVLTGEKCFFEMLQYADNQGLYGEATAAVLLRTGDGEGGTRVVATRTGVFDGVYAPMVAVPKEVTQAFDQAFLPRMTALVTGLLAAADLAPEEIDVIFPTHLSPFTSDRVANLTGMTRAEIWKVNLPRVGHCYCGDLFLNYRTWLASDATEGATRILSFASGMTGSYAGVVLERT